jgi:penicillin-binding protein 1C
LLLAALPAIAFPEFSQLRARYPGSESIVFDRHGEPIQQMRTDLHVRQLGWIGLSGISRAAIAAIVLSEDHRFYAHHGVDWWALLSAAGGRLIGRPARGASTLSMQVAAMIDPSLRPRHVRRDWLQKLFQMRAAWQLEKQWTKEQILEAYLNLIPIRGELRGVGAAARALFGKDASGLDREESEIVAALIRAPAAELPAVARRACALGRRAGAADGCDRIRRLVAESGLRTQPFALDSQLAPHAARWLLAHGLTHSTLDRRIQQRVREILRRQVLMLHDRNLRDAAAIVVDNRTGEVRAYVGSVGELSPSPFVDGVLARRQAGSALKPFLYSLALEKKILTASSHLDDSPLDISLGQGAVYRPRDFDNVFHGPDVTLRTALASSLNVPAVRTLGLVGVQSLVDRLRALGFDELRSEEYYGPSLALGTADVTLWELTNAFRTLANQGLASPMTLSPRQPPVPRSVVSAAAAFVVQDILSDRQSRSLTFGLDSPLSLPFWAAAKTGTSKDMRDNWCIGFSSRYTVGVWTGNFSGLPMWNVSGISGAAPAWAEILVALHEAGRDTPPRVPAGVVRVAGEWYLQGTEPVGQIASRPAPAILRPHIVYPVEGLVVARDPDIPSDRQRVFFESSPATSGFSWYLGDERLAPASSAYAWAIPHAGDYELKLVAVSGETVDRVHFSVRGSGSETIPSIPSSAPARR